MARSEETHIYAGGREVRISSPDRVIFPATDRTPVLDHAQYIGSTEQGRELGAVDLLVDALIERARADGKRWFDFGISTTDDGRHLNEGLVRNKESYGARGVAYDWYELDLKVLG